MLEILGPTTGPRIDRIWKKCGRPRTHAHADAMPSTVTVGRRRRAPSTSGCSEIKASRPVRARHGPPRTDAAPDVMHVVAFLYASRASGQRLLLPSVLLLSVSSSSFIQFFLAPSSSS
jgi:hypothetical protein